MPNKSEKSWILYLEKALTFKQFEINKDDCFTGKKGFFIANENQSINSFIKHLIGIEQQKQKGLNNFVDDMRSYMQDTCSYFFDVGQNKPEFDANFDEEDSFNLKMEF